MDIIKKITKPLSKRSLRNLRRIKTLSIIILSLFVIGEYSYRIKTEALYKDKIIEYKESMADIKSELMLIRNSIPVSIEKMTLITNTIISIQKIMPYMKLPTAEYYATLISNEAIKYDNINPDMLVSIIKKESYFMADTISCVGAVGLGQIMPTTGKWIVEDKWQLPYSDSLLYDPVMNIKITAWYLSHLLQQNNNNFKLALAYYNGGYWQARRYKLLLKSKTGSALSIEETNQVSKIPKETLEYVPSVIKYYKIIKKLHIKQIED